MEKFFCDRCQIDITNELQKRRIIVEGYGSQESATLCENCCKYSRLLIARFMDKSDVKFDAVINKIADGSWWTT
jgi:hypothetical protein